MKTVLVCVGCGGVFYHGMSQISPLVAREGIEKVVLVDPDTVEEKNAGRQWGSVGMLKVNTAILALMNMGVEVKILQAIGEKFTSKVMDGMDKFDRVVLVATPDNHRCRMEVLNAGMVLVDLLEVEVVVVIGGNGVDGGYAYGMWMKGEEVMGNWDKRHPDIREEAEKEALALANPEGCGNLDESEEQSVGGNHMTGYCVWRTVEVVMGHKQGYEMLWTADGGRGVNIKGRIVNEPEEKESEV